VEVAPLPSGASKRAQVRAMFDRIAPRYDALNRLLSAGLDRRWRRLALAAVAVGPGDTVLDLACGTGDLMELATARGARVLGVDMALGMLRVARRRGLAGGLAQGDAVALPLPDAWASVVCCGFALRNFVSLEPVLHEIARVLAPGGRLALLEIDRPESSWVRAGHELWFERMVPWLGGLLSDRAAYAYLPRSVAYLPQAPELRARLETAGFERVHRRPLLFGAAQLVTARRREPAR
jgi:demethylmenaquinone methyltransferase/2-methoxy-6-polyprenyl-1,4-benzoquinol methylase